MPDYTVHEGFLINVESQNPRDGYDYFEKVFSRDDFSTVVGQARKCGKAAMTVVTLQDRKAVYVRNSFDNPATLVTLEQKGADENKTLVRFGSLSPFILEDEGLFAITVDGPDKASCFYKNPESPVFEKDATVFSLNRQPHRLRVCGRKLAAQKSGLFDYAPKLELTRLCEPSFEVHTGLANGKRKNHKEQLSRMVV